MAAFTRATPSVGARTTGLALEVVNQLTELQAINYKLKQNSLAAESETAKSLGNAQEAALDRNADNQAYTGWGDIGLGGAQGASVGLTEAWSALPYTNINQEISAEQSKVDNLDSWEKALENPTAAQNQAANGPGPQHPQDMEDGAFAQVKDDLNGFDVEMKKVTDDDRDTLELAKGAKKPELDAKLDDLKKQTRTKRKRAESRRDSLENRKSSIKRNVTELGSAAAQLIRGSLQTAGAQFKYQEGEQQNIQAQAQFSFESMKSALQSEDSQTESKEQAKQGAVNTLLGGIARSNEIRG